MSLSFGSILCFISLILASRKNIYALLECVIFWQVVAVGYFLKTNIPGFSIISYPSFTMYYFVIYMLFTQPRNLKLNKRSLFLWSFFLIVCLISILSNINTVIPSSLEFMETSFNIVTEDTGNYLRIFKLFFDTFWIFLAVEILRSVYKRSEAKKAIQRGFFIASLALIITAVMEILFKEKFRLTLLNLMGYHEKSIVISDVARFDIIGFSSLTAEPSQLALFFFLSIIVLYYKGKLKGYFNFYIFIIFLTIILSSSTSGFIGIILFCLINLTSIHFIKGISCYLLLTISTFSLFGGFQYIYKLLNVNLSRIASLFTHQYIGSEGTRFLHMKTGVDLFLQKPIFGIGKLLKIFNFIPSLITCFGIMGFLAFFLLVKEIGKFSSKNIIPFILVFIYTSISGSISMVWEFLVWVVIYYLSLMNSENIDEIVKRSKG